MLVAPDGLYTNAFREASMSKKSSTPPVVYKDIPDFPGYRVGDDGSVWSCRSPRGGLVGRWKRLKPNKSLRYATVALRKGGRYYYRYVARLVLEAFVGPCPPGMEACHFPDRNRSNNRLDNLRWDEHAANMADMAIHGTRLRGSQIRSAKLSESNVEIILLELLSGRTATAIAAEHDVCRKTIGDIRCGRKWAHVRPDIKRWLVNPHTTQRQRDAARKLRADGLASAAIARRLNLSAGTVRRIVGVKRRAK